MPRNVVLVGDRDRPCHSYGRCGSSSALWMVLLLSLARCLNRFGRFGRLPIQATASVPQSSPGAATFYLVHGSIHRFFEVFSYETGQAPLVVAPGGTSVNTHRWHLKSKRLAGSLYADSHFAPILFG